MSARRAAGALGLLLTLADCTAFPVVETDVCGNAVVERPREDCDTFAEPPLSCRPPGSDGACHYDCRLTADGTRAPCPSGSGCGADGICRQPSGEFELGVNFASDPSSWVSTLDFDGDHKPDVVSADPADEFRQARFRLHYFDADAKLVESKTFPRVTTRPIPIRGAGGAASDLVFSNFRVGLLPGRRDREWVPAAFSSYVVPNSSLRIAGVSNDFVSDASPLIALTTLDGVNGAYVPDFVTGSGLGLRIPLAKSVHELAGVPLVANLIEGADSPCDELVLAYRGEQSFTVYDMCQPGDEHQVYEAVVWRETPEAKVVRLPAGLVVDAGPIAADVDGDGHLDVVIGAGGHPYLALGDGRRLEPTATAFALDVYDGRHHDHADSVDRPMPLAVGDYSGDGVADFVEPERLLTSRKQSSGTSYFTSYTNRAEAWTMAEVGDLNGNGLLDVVAATEGANSLAFFNGTGGPFQIGTTLVSQGPLRLLTTGDFDGDLVRDIAWLQAGAGDESDSLAVAFGVRDLVPLPAKRVAELSGAEQLGHYGSLGLDNLFIASEQRVDGVDYTKLTLFDNGPDRLPFAPYSLVTFATDHGIEDSSAAVIVAGAFTKPDVTDVVALGSPTFKPEPGKEIQWQAWLLPDIGSGKQQPRLLAGDLPAGVEPINAAGADGRRRLSVMGTAADVDGDGLDEALWLASRGEAGCSLFVTSIDGQDSKFSDLARLDLEEPCPSPELSAADLDGDGALDLLVLIGDPAQKPRRLQLLFNDGKGGFSEEDRRFVGGPKGHDVRGFSVFTTSASSSAHCTPPTRLAFVTDNSLNVASNALDAESPCQGAQPRQLDQVTTLQAFDDARSVTVTDPNGDGIEDLVVADAAGLWLVEAHLR